MTTIEILRAALLVSGLSPIAAQAADRAAKDPTVTDRPANPTLSQSTDGDQEVIVTGTRRTGVRAADSAAPIELIDAGTLARTGRPDLNQALNATVPSFTAQSFGGDAGNLKLSARLRGLSANHALVLVNGKRRHGSSNLTVGATGGFGGAASADLAFIPMVAIDHVEVLTDGAAAQYGTDAIAGVINIILKNAHKGGQLVASGGAYGEGDGETFSGAGNFGIGSEDAYLNVSVEHRYHDYSDRGGPDQRVFTAANRANPALPLLPGYPHLNRIFGDARYELTTAFYNAGLTLDGVELYSFGSYGHRYGQSRQNFRFPNVAPRLWPQGFTPVLANKEDDYGVTAGIRGALADWRWDLSSTYGRDINRIHNNSSANTSLIADTGTSPTNFHVGDFLGSQWTNTLDVARGVDVGLASPLTIAFGAEFRRETYEIREGDPASRYKIGVAAYPGFALTDAGTHARHNVAGYIDLAVSPVEKLQLDAAGRFEHFNDFGDTWIGKLTGRYDFTPAFAVRGTASTGFRAPTLAEQYYSATSVSPTSASVRLPANSAAARLLGFTGLKPEKSTNFSAGVALSPARRLTATLDVYQISVRDRIVSTGSVFGLQTIGGVRVVRSQAVTDAITANGNTIDPTVTSTSIATFVNGADTRTRGIELVVGYGVSLSGDASLDWTLTGNYNDTKLTELASSSSQIAASGQRYLDQGAISYIETVSPKLKLSLDNLFRKDKWTIDLRGTLFGRSSVDVDGGNTGVFVKNVFGTRAIVDLDVRYDITPRIGVSVGGSNLLNTYAAKINPVTYAAGLATGGNGVATTNSWSPYGINGGYYYSRINIKL